MWRLLRVSREAGWPALGRVGKRALGEAGGGKAARWAEKGDEGVGGGGGGEGGELDVEGGVARVLGGALGGLGVGEALLDGGEGAVGVGEAGLALLGEANAVEDPGLEVGAGEVGVGLEAETL